jgi:hypothetical protein
MVLDGLYFDDELPLRCGNSLNVSAAKESKLKAAVGPHPSSVTERAILPREPSLAHLRFHILDHHQVLHNTSYLSTSTTPDSDLLPILGVILVPEAAIESMMAFCPSAFDFIPLLAITAGSNLCLASIVDSTAVNST